MRASTPGSQSTHPPSSPARLTPRATAPAGPRTAASTTTPASSTFLLTGNSARSRRRSTWPAESPELTKSPAGGAGQAKPFPGVIPVNVPTGKFTDIAMGAVHACAVRTSGALACWGANPYGQTDAPSGSYTAVSAGWAHSCALTTDGEMICWGHDGNYDELLTYPHSAYRALWMSRCRRHAGSRLPEKPCVGATTARDRPMLRTGATSETPTRHRTKCFRPWTSPVPTARPAPSSTMAVWSAGALMSRQRTASAHHARNTAVDPGRRSRPTGASSQSAPAGVTAAG